MRNRLLLFLLLFAFSFSGWNVLRAGGGGPDPFGYVWKDSNEPDLDYNWVEIIGRAGAVQVNGLADDNAVGPLSIGWDFHYYWSDYNSIRIGSNGWIAFSFIGNIASCFPQVPSPGGVGDNILAPFMSDLTFSSNSGTQTNPGQLWYWSNSQDSFVLEWKNVPWWQNNTPDWIGQNTFQVILSGIDSSITFQYFQTTPAQFPGGTGCPTFMEIGMENVTGDLGLNVSTGTTVPASNYAIKFYYPQGANFLVPDATPVWSLNPENGAEFVYTNSPLLLNTQMRNVGNTTISGNISVSGLVRDLQFVQAWADTGFVNNLAVGLDQSVNFADTLWLSQPGQYFFDVQASPSASQDINPTNNDNSIEIVAIRNTTGRVELGYSTGFPPTDAVSWAGGNADDGLAIKIIPPDYPAIIDSVRLYLIHDGNASTPPPVGCSVKVLGLDGNGLPDFGNVLGTGTLAANDVQEDAWNSVALTSSVAINSGGFAIAWLQGGVGLSLGAEQFGPISRRTYEILGGAVSPYRSNSSTDLLMSAVSSLPVAIKEPISPLQSFGLFPNPANTAAQLTFALEKPAQVEMSLMNLQGQILVQGPEKAFAQGRHELSLDLNALPAGMYWVVLKANGLSSTRRLAVQR